MGMTKLPSVPAVPLPSLPSPEATGRQPAGLPSPAAAPAGMECDGKCAFCDPAHHLHAAAVEWMDLLFEGKA